MVFVPAVQRIASNFFRGRSEGGAGRLLARTTGRFGIKLHSARPLTLFPRGHVVRSYAAVVSPCECSPDIVLCSHGARRSRWRKSEVVSGRGERVCACEPELGICSSGSPATSPAGPPGAAGRSAETTKISSRGMMSKTCCLSPPAESARFHEGR